MAPPSSRRPGFSRRAQYGLLAGYAVAVAGAVFGLLLVATSWFDPQGSGAIRQLVAEVTTPVATVTNAVLRGAGQAASEVGAYVKAGSRNAELSRELAEARREAIRLRGIAQENRRLKALLGIVDPDTPPVAVARLVSSPGASSRRFAVLNRGSRSGVASGQPVRAAEGLIGRITGVGPNSARVLLIVDSGNVVPVRRQRDGLPAIATGRGDGMIDLRPLVAGNQLFRVSDLFVTSGVGGIFKPDIPVARVVTLTGDGATARPLADPDRGDHVIVEPPYFPEAAAPPAGPAPAPAPAGTP